MSKDAITSAVKALAADIGIRIVGKGYLTRGDGAGTLVADQTSRLAFYWVRSDKGKRVVGEATLHPKSSIVFQDNVDYETIEIDLGYVQKDDKLYILDQSSFGFQGGGTTFIEQKIYEAANTVMLPLSVVADRNQPSLTVFVRQWYPVIGGTAYWFPHTAQDLTSYVPGSANQMCYAVIFVQNDYQTLEVQTSTPRSTSSLPLGLADEQEAIDAASAGTVPVFAVKLVNGQTAISQNDLNNDGRPLQPYVWIDTSGGGTFYQTVQGNGTPATQEPIIDFINGTNTTVTVTDDGPGTRTKVRIDATDTDTGITQLTGDVTAGPGSGSQVATLANSGVTPASYTNTSLTVDSKGRLTAASSGATPAPVGATYITQTSDATLTNEQALSALATGYMKSTTTTGVVTTQATPIPAADIAVLPIGNLADAWKLPAKLVATTNISVSSAPATVDGTAFNSGDRVLLTAQTSGPEDGLWQSTGSGNPMVRPSDFAAGSTLFAYQRVMVFVVSGNGTTNAGSFWSLNTSGTVTIDTTSQSWTRVKINVNSDMAGQLPIGNGGTGVATLTAHNLLVGGSSLAFLAPGVIHNVIVSDGTDFVSQALAAAEIPNLDASKITTGQLATARGGTGQDFSASSGIILLSSGTASATAKYRLPLFDHFANVASTATSSEEDLYTDTLANGQFGTNGDKVFVRYGVTYANNARTKRIRSYVGGTQVLDTTSIGGGVAGVVDIDFMVIRVSSSVLRIIAHHLFNNSVFQAFYTEVTGLTLSGGIIIKITSTVASGAANDTIARLGSIEFEGAA